MHTHLLIEQQSQSTLIIIILIKNYLIQRKTTKPPSNLGKKKSSDMKVQSAMENPWCVEFRGMKVYRRQIALEEINVIVMVQVCVLRWKWTYQLETECRQITLLGIINFLCHPSLFIVCRIYWTTFRSR